MTTEIAGGPGSLRHLPDLVLAALLLEIALVAWLRPRALKRVLLAAAAGGCIALALRAALMGAGWPWAAAWLAAAAPFHLLDLRSRLRDAAHK